MTARPPPDDRAPLGDGTADAFVCGGPCTDGRDHSWDGPVVEFSDGDGSSATCSRCGVTAYDYLHLTLP